MVTRAWAALVAATAVATRVALAVAVVAAPAGCQGRRRDGDQTGGGPQVEALADGAGGGGGGSGGSGGGSGGFGSSADPVNVGSGSSAEGPDPTRKVAIDEPESPPDPNKQIAELGAIPAWQAVVDRAQLLARRGQKGVVYGRIGPALLVPAPPLPSPPAPAPAPAPPGPVDAGVPTSGAPIPGAPPPALDAGLVASPYVWLVDDSEGNGSLGIRIALGKLQAMEGDRIAVSGAWELDSERHWYWKAEALQPLSPATASEPKDPPAAVPSHIPATGGFPPNVRPIKQAKDNDVVYFQIVGPTPSRDGDGWLIAAQAFDLPIALLILPGERPSYGGQDLRAADERWQIKLRQTYWVRIGKIRPQGPGKPFVVRALTGPIRVM